MAHHPHRTRLGQSKNPHESELRDAIRRNHNSVVVRQLLRRADAGDDTDNPRRAVPPPRLYDIDPYENLADPFIHFDWREKLVLAGIGIAILIGAAAIYYSIASYLSAP